MNNREKGSDLELMAADLLMRKGYVLLEHSYSRKTGEIDLIMRDGQCFVFVEVKYRRSTRIGYPEEAVTPVKQRHIMRTAAWYLKEHHLNGVPCRFDVVSILGREYRHIKNAFGGF